MSEMSPTLTRFFKSLDPTFSNRESWDSLDLAAFDSLDDADRATALAWIVDLAGRGDLRAVAALQHIGSEQAVERLRHLVRPLEGDSVVLPEVSIAAMEALHRLGEERSILDLKPETVVRLPTSARHRIACLAGELKGDWEAMLTALIGDSERNVRLAAARSMFERVGLLGSAESVGSAAWILKMWLATPLPGIRKRAQAEFHALATRFERDKEEPQRSSDPSTSLNAFLDSMLCAPGQEPWADAFDHEALQRLTGLERDYMEMSLVSKLFLVEPRAPAALVALGAEKGLAALGEFQGMAMGRMRSAVDTALDNG
jgi:hypothetical protein